MGAPTLIVGIGGIGGSIITRLAERIERERVENVELVVMDTDVNDLRKIRERFRNIYTVQTSPKGTVGKALDANRHAREKWFPLNDGLTGKPFTEGAGQVRAVSRLAFDYAVEQGHMEELEKAIAKLHGLNSEAMRQEMRVIITGSIAGGTGSGLVLPVAMYIRNFLITRYQDNSAIIRGFFLEPDVVFGRLLDENERNTQRANAYAAVREMDAFFRKEYSGESDEYSHVVFNAPQPGLGDRVDYPNILPYHFVFLMDALNANGDSLTDLEGRYDLEAYKQHAADCIYAQALSAVSARSNSSEDNVIRQLAANNGRSRYCGAGSACLEYPKDTVQRYIALNWAEQTISGEWLEIDEEFKLREREEPGLKRDQFYCTEYEARRGSGSAFYKTVMARAERKDENGEHVDVVDLYVSDVAQHAENWAKSGLLAECTPLRRCLFEGDNRPKLRPLTTDGDMLLEKCEDGDPSGVMQEELGGFFDKVRRYSSVSQEEVPTRAAEFARSAFSISDFDDNPLKSRTQGWQLESVFAVAADGETGSYHPAAARYNLYKLSEALSDRALAAQSEAERAKKAIQDAERADYYSETEEKEDVAGAVAMIFSEDKSKKGKFRLPIPVLKKGAVGSAEIDMLVDIATRLNKLKNNVDAYVTNVVAYEFLQAAKRYVDNLSASYEAFYDHLSKEIAGIRADIARIEQNPAFNAPKGRSHRYVCADVTCMREMKSQCYMRSTSAELPVELCGDIYRSLLRYSKARDAAKSYSARNEISSELFKRLFKDVVIDYWQNLVLDTNKGYPAIIDKSIVQAIADEALYTTDRVFFDQQDQNDYAEGYVLRTLEGMKKLATPFIEPPVGEYPRRIEICAFADNAFENAGACAEGIRQVLWNSYNGTEVSGKEFSKYEILFYSSMYGFCATNLPKYAPAHTGMESRPEGEYHRAYFATVNQLSPNLKDNRLITPHIDRNWHLVCALPDINPDNERAIQHNIVHAFLHGLVFQRFAAEPVIDGDDVYYLKATADRARTSLWVSNGTSCDRFYEVFDALKFSPPAVELLLKSSRSRLQGEKKQPRVLSLKDCDLITAIRSHAFSKIDFEAWGTLIQNAVSSPEEHSDLWRAPINVEGSRVRSTAVTDLFGIGLPDDDVRRTSIFEIPLVYRISLPQSELRESEINMMVESIFRTVRDHVANFCDESDLAHNCGQLFEEQYMLFEQNLIAYENEFTNINTSVVVSAVREKVLGYMEADESLSKRQARIRTLQNRLDSVWRKFRENRWN